MNPIFVTNKYYEFAQAIGKGPNERFLESKIHLAKYKDSKSPIDALLETNSDLTKDQITNAKWTMDILIDINSKDFVA